MPYTYSQFTDDLHEILELGPEIVLDGMVLRKVLLSNGERFTTDAALIFQSPEQAASAAGEHADL